MAAAMRLGWYFINWLSNRRPKPKPHSLRTSSIVWRRPPRMQPPHQKTIDTEPRRNRRSDAPPEDPRLIDLHERIVANWLPISGASPPRITNLRPNEHRADPAFGRSSLLGSPLFAPGMTPRGSRSEGSGKSVWLSTLHDRFARRGRSARTTGPIIRQPNPARPGQSIRSSPKCGTTTSRRPASRSETG